MCVSLATRRIYSCKSHRRFVLSGTIQLCQKAEGHTCRRHHSAACIIMLPPFRIILTLGSAPLDITRYLAHPFGTNDDTFVLYQGTLCSLHPCLSGTLSSLAPFQYFSFAKVLRQVVVAGSPSILSFLSDLPSLLLLPSAPFDFCHLFAVF